MFDRQNRFRALELKNLAKDIFLVLEDVSIIYYFKNTSPTGLETLATMHYTSQMLDYAHICTETGHELPLKIVILQYQQTSVLFQLQIGK